MLHTLAQARASSLPVRIAGIGAFAALTALAARVTIETGGPVPFTLQVLPTLLSGLVLGWRDGALSQALYVGLIALGLSLDARALGPAVFASPTAGFLVGFIPAAAVAGAVAQLQPQSARMRWAVRWLAGLVGLAALYAVGVPWLALNLNLSLGAAFDAVAVYIPLDAVKALLAAGLTEGSRAALSGRYAKVQQS